MWFQGNTMFLTSMTMTHFLKLHYYKTMFMTAWYDGNTMFFGPGTMVIPCSCHLSWQCRDSCTWTMAKPMFLDFYAGNTFSLYHVFDVMAMAMHVCLFLHHGSTMFFLLYYVSNYIYFFNLYHTTFLTSIMTVQCLFDLHLGNTMFFFHLQYDNTIWWQGHGFLTCTMVILCFLDMLPW